jgi:hypothetical protein
LSDLVTAHPDPLVAGTAVAYFLEKMGHDVFEALGASWVRFRGPVYRAVPDQLRLDPDPEKLARALRSVRVAAVRYTTATAPGLPGGMFMCRTRGYSIQRVHPNYRRYVKRGMASCEIRQVDPGEFLASGLELNLDTMRRQKRFDPRFGEASRWEKVVRAVRDCPGVTVVGAFVSGRLSSYAICCRDGAWINVLYRNSRTEDLPLRVSYALDHWLLCEAATDPGVEGVTNAFASFTGGAEAEGLREYKLRLGYELVACSFGIAFHPALAPVLSNRVAVAAAEALSRLRPGSGQLELLSKTLRAARITRTLARPQ